MQIKQYFTLYVLMSIIPLSLYSMDIDRLRNDHLPSINDRTLPIMVDIPYNQNNTDFIGLAQGLEQESRDTSYMIDIPEDQIKLMSTLFIVDCFFILNQKGAPSLDNYTPYSIANNKKKLRNIIGFPVKSF